MGYYHIKNIDINKKEGTITADFADNNVHPISYFKSEIKGDTFHEKYSYFMYDIIAGNYHPSSNSRYDILCNSWGNPALKNFINDSNILGIERAYDKYQNVIEDILNKKEPEIIKSEIELHYKLDYGKNKDYNTLKNKVNELCNFMKGIKDNKNLSSIDKLQLYQTFVKENEISFPLVTLIGVEHSTKMYLKPNITKDGFVSYSIIVENTETGKLKSYDSDYMGIGWITDYGENEMAYKIQSYEMKFIIFQKINRILDEKTLNNSSPKLVLSIENLDVKNDEIRTLLDILQEDPRVPDFEYDRVNKEIKINFEKENQLEQDIVDEMFG